jgi:hypothetical protein
MSSSFCLIWARRCSRLLKGKNEHSSSSGEEVDGEGARENTQSSTLGRTAAGSSETELPCEHCDGQSHFLKRHRLYALSLRELRGSGRAAITMPTCVLRPCASQVEFYRSRLCQ